MSGKTYTYSPIFDPISALPGVLRAQRFCDSTSLAPVFCWNEERTITRMFWRPTGSVGLGRCQIALVYDPSANPKLVLPHHPPRFSS